MIKEGTEMVERYGFKALKLKVGVDPTKDIEMVKTMRKELGDDILIASATKNPYKIGQIGVTLSPNKKEGVLWVRSDSIKSRSWLY